jgi:hypothetical protein
MQLFTGEIFAVLGKLYNNQYYNWQNLKIHKKKKKIKNVLIISVQFVSQNNQL